MMKLNPPELIALGLAGVAVLLITKAAPKPAASSKAAPSRATAAGTAPQLFSGWNTWDNNPANDYATQASYTPASMGTDPFGLDNNPANDSGAAMSYAPWAVARVAPW